MTTIAYNHKRKEIAVDGRLTAPCGVITNDKYIKVIAENGNHWFLAGSISDHQLLIDIHNGEKSVNYELDAYALRVDKDGNVDLCANIDNGAPTIEPITYNYAIGTGYQFALAAMDFGRSAKEAVQYAAKRDSNTGGAIWAATIHELKERSKNAC